MLGLLKVSRHWPGAYMEKYKVDNTSISSIWCFLCQVPGKSDKRVSEQETKVPFLPMSAREKLHVLRPELRYRPVFFAETLSLMMMFHLWAGVTQSPGKVRKGWGIGCRMGSPLCKMADQRDMQLQKSLAGRRDVSGSWWLLSVLRSH
jgi:hypothetical protein